MAAFRCSAITYQAVQGSWGWHECDRKMHGQLVDSMLSALLVRALRQSVVTARTSRAVVRRVRSVRHMSMDAASASAGAACRGAAAPLGSSAAAPRAAASDITHPPMDWEKFRREAHQMVDFIADYMKTGVEAAPVLSQVKPGYLRDLLPSQPPQDPEPFERIMEDVQRAILPGVTHWQSPNFFAFFPANSSPASLLGDMLSSGLGVQGMLWITSPACTELEILMLDWLAHALQMPPVFLSTSGTGGGVIQNTASDGALVAVTAARHRYQQAHPDAGPDAVSRMVLYLSEQAHISVQKSARIAGVMRVRSIATDERLAMRTDALADAIAEDRAAGLIPLLVCATVGTTSTTAVDPLPDIGRLCQREQVWLHVDAAYAGSACICPEFRPLLEGVERADSVVFNPHKWLLVNFDCSVLWCGHLPDKRAITQALSSITTPAYLSNKFTESGAVVDYRDWQVALGRRFRALKLWFVLRQYGVRGLQQHIRAHVQWAAEFEAWVRADPRFEVTAPRTLALVCFRLRARNDVNQQLLQHLNASGALYLSGTVLPGDVFTLRMAIGAANTQRAHVQAAWARIQDAAARLLQGDG